MPAPTASTDTHEFDLESRGLTGHAGTLEADARHLGVDQGPGLDPGVDLDNLGGGSGIDGRIDDGTGGLHGLGSSTGTGPADGDAFVSDGGGYPAMEVIHTIDTAATLLGVPLAVIPGGQVPGALLSGWGAGRVIGDAIFEPPGELDGFGSPEPLPGATPQEYTPSESSGLLGDISHTPAPAPEPTEVGAVTVGSGQTVAVVGVKASDPPSGGSGGTTEDQTEGTMSPHQGGLGALPTEGTVESLQQGLGGQRGGDVDPADEPVQWGGEQPYDLRDSTVDPGPDGFFSAPPVDESALPDADDLASPYVDDADVDL